MLTQPILYLTTKYKYDFWFPVPGNNCMSFPLDPTITEVEEKTEVIYGAVNSTLKSNSQLPDLVWIIELILPDHRCL